jgi:hypothetical protein
MFELGWTKRERKKATIGEIERRLVYTFCCKNQESLVLYLKLDVSW